MGGDVRRLSAAPVERRLGAEGQPRVRVCACGRMARRQPRVPLSCTQPPGLYAFMRTTRPRVRASWCRGMRGLEGGLVVGSLV